MSPQRAYKILTLSGTWTQWKRRMVEVLISPPVLLATALWSLNNTPGQTDHVRKRSSVGTVVTDAVTS